MKFETIMTFEYILAMKETPNILVIGEKCIPCMCEVFHYGDRVGIKIECKFLPDKTLLMDLINNRNNIIVNGKGFYLGEAIEKCSTDEHYIKFDLISKKSIESEYFNIAKVMGE